VRTHIPQSITDACDVFIADFVIPRSRLPEGFEPEDNNATTIDIRAQSDDDGWIIARRPHGDHIERFQAERVDMTSERGLRIQAAIVQANIALFEQGITSRPALVLISFDRLSQRGAFLANLAERIRALKFTKPTRADLRFAAQLVTDETAIYHRRQLLPQTLTDGHAVFAADLWIHRPYLKNGCLQGERLLPCIAEPGPCGGIEHAPFSWEEFEDFDEYVARNA
jgi:hypothetical protein